MQAMSRFLVSSRTPFGIEDQLAIDRVADVTLERPQRLSLGLALGDLAIEVGPTLRWGWRIWQIATMWMALLRRRWPRSESRWNIRPPEECSTGAIPA